MTLIAQITHIADIFCQARGLSMSRVSTLVFNDGKRLPSIIAGGDLYTARFEHAMSWFSANWPEGAEWPAEVPRPPVTQTLSPADVPHHDNPAADFTTDGVAP